MPGTTVAGMAGVAFGWQPASHQLIADVSAGDRWQIAVWRPGQTRLTTALARAPYNSWPVRVPTDARIAQPQSTTLKSDEGRSRYPHQGRAGTPGAGQLVAEPEPCRAWRNEPVPAQRRRVGDGDAARQAASTTLPGRGGRSRPCCPPPWPGPASRRWPPGRRRDRAASRSMRAAAWPSAAVQRGRRDRLVLLPERRQHLRSVLVGGSSSRLITVWRSL